MTTTNPQPTIRPERLKGLLSSLLDIYSPSGKEEEILQFLEIYLRDRGLSPLRQTVEDSRFNLVVLPPGGNAALALIAHIDTVAAHDYDRYGFEERGDLIFGLGAADMKSGCAAMIEAYVTLMGSASAPYPVALALVVGEEEEGDGCRRLVRDYHFPWAVIGEPTAPGALFEALRLPGTGNHNSRQTHARLPRQAGRKTPSRPCCVSS